MAPKLPPTLRASLLCSFMFNQTQISINPLPSISFTNHTSTFLQPNPSFFSPKISFLFSTRSFSSSPSSGDILLIGSEHEFSAALSKALDEKLPTVFYFTATWCPPCKMLSPVVAEMSKKYPHVKTYKIDIDQDGLQSVLSKHSISSVPTLYFYQDGKKADQMVGADLNGLKRTMENLYNRCRPPTSHVWPSSEFELSDSKAATKVMAAMDSNGNAIESLEIAFEVSNILETGLDRHTLSILIALVERGVNPEALAALVRELSQPHPMTSSFSASNPFNPR